MPYGINCNRVDGRDVDECNLVWVICHVEHVQIGGWGECEPGGVGASRYNGGGSVSWQVNRGGVDKDGAIGRACDPGRGGGDEHGAIWVRCDTRGQWFGGHGGFGGEM